MWLWSKEVVSKKLKALEKRVACFNRLYGRSPSLTIVRVGYDEASRVYVNHKLSRARDIGIKAREDWINPDVSEDQLLNHILSLNNDAEVDGFIVQLPLPSHLNWQRIVDAVDPLKDVDGFTSLNLGKLFCGMPDLLPATPKGILALLDHYEVELDGSFAVVIGRSRIVGRPVAALLEHRNATVTLCHSHTPHSKLVDLCRQADVVVCAVGRPYFVKPDMIKEGAVVVDVGINRKEGRLLGDVDPSVEKKARVSPVPGGVGPLTVVSLLENVVEVAEKRKKS